MNALPKEVVEGSALWQQVFLAASAVFILLQMRTGWKLGPMRMLTNIAALLGAYAAAYFGGPLTVPFLRQFLTYPDLLLRVIGGLVLGLLTYLFCSMVGAILFRKTRDQESGLVRSIYGVTGSLLGILTALFLIWLVVIGVRLVGTVGEGQIVAQRQAEAELGPPNASAGPAAGAGKFVAKLKNSIEMGVGEAVVEKVDVVPEVVYRLLEKLSIMVSNPVNVDRFMQYPGAAELANHPKIQALKDDPEIQKLAQEGRYMEMMRNQKIIEAANDPELAAKLKEFELEKAMDFALQRPAVPGAPLRHTPLR
jgi:hypothetical protein